ncbi:Deoxyribonuclease (DNase) II [Trichuris trichiura]|uniref:Deoxyribonuclease (DNase) II n=1 Tax=Trichuris trichiura TaxID=36087 RepID=A0A077YY50_TRITR|nr:Deoxyribonuclease (DNase) II [Trichuris trichiura]
MQQKLMGVLYVVPQKQAARAIFAAAAPAWEQQEVDLTPADGVLGELFTPFFTAQTKPNYNVIAFSNFPPKFRAPLSTYSPAKGVLGYTDTDGWWLTHSVGQWPDMTAAAYAAPAAGNAGLIVCLSLPFGSMRSWANVLKFEDPVIYYYQSATTSPATSIENINELNDLTQKSSPVVYPPFVRGMTFTTAGTNGALTTFVGKASKAFIDIYSKYMGVLLQQSLIVWSDQSSKAKLPSSCTGKYKVENVKPAQTITVDSVAIKRSEDTSNWAVSKDAGTTAVFCVSDAIRTKAWKNMPGGVVCLQQQQLQTLFNTIANTAEIERCLSNG